MQNLDKLRQRIDAADEALIEALAQRMEVVEHILRRKAAHGLPLFDSEREGTLLERMKARALARLVDPCLVERVLREVIRHSREVQSRRVQEAGNPELATVARVAYQGTKGAYSWLACRKHFGGRVDAIGYASFPEVVRAVEEEQVDVALLPIENVLAGGIYEVHDLLAQSRLHVVGEVVIRIEHCLIGLAGTPLEQIRSVLSHPVALQQCTTLVDRLPNANRQPYIDSAEAVRKVKQDADPTQAAIASAETARLYGLDVLREGISDHSENFTRFWALSREPVTVDPRIPAKTAVLLVTDHRQGALVACLKTLAAHEINLTQLQSRPRRGMPWQYQFHLEMEGNVQQKNLIEALEAVRTRARVLRVLGCFPRADAIGTIAEKRRFPPPSKSPRIRSSKSPPKARASVVMVGDIPVGKGSFTILAGPNEPVTERQLETIAQTAQDGGADIFRAGRIRLRGSGGTESRRKMRRQMTRWLRPLRLPLAIEVWAAEEVGPTSETVDLLIVGSSNMLNRPLLEAVGQAGKPVLLRRNVSSTLSELLSAVETILSQGNQQIILCERGLRSLESATRHTLDLSGLVALKEEVRLPVIVDPTTAVTRPSQVVPLARAVRAAGADGLMVAIGISQQVGTGTGMLTSESFGSLVEELREP